MQAYKVSVYSRAPSPNLEAPVFYWYREGSEEEKKKGKHIAVQDIITEKELEIRLRKRVDYDC